MTDKAPAFQWYPRDYLTDPVVVAMSLEAEGAYRRLLDYCWLEGSLPAEHEQLAPLAKARSLAHFEKLWAQFGSKFELNAGGRLVHRRLEAERIKQEEWKAELSKAGSRGAAGRWRGHSQAIARPRPGHQEANGQSMPLQSSSASAVQTPSVSVAREGQSTPRIATGPHRQHAFCGTACVPAFLHQEFIRGLNRADHDEADEELRAGYRAHLAAWPEGKATGDALLFWRAWYRQRYTPVAAFGAGRTAGNAAALAAVLSTNRKAVVNGLD